MDDDKLFKIEPVSGEIRVDKRKTESPYNSVKNFKYANLPAQCNDCVYRSREAGGNGKCSVYELDAACAIRKDISKFLSQIDTRNMEDLKALLDMLAKMSMETLMLAYGQGKLDGNIPDRNTRSEVNQVLAVAKLIIECNDKITISEKKTFSASGDLENLFRELKKDHG